MANATTRVQMATTPYGDDKVERPLAATVTTYYPGTLIGLDSSGNANKCDDSAAYKFDGVNAESDNVTVNTGESAGDRVLKVERPFGFAMYIASAAAGDEGKAVYSAFDNEVAYTSTYGNLVGWVDKVLSATSVFIRPVWRGAPPPRPVATVASAGSAQGDAASVTADITTVTGADGTKGVILPAAVPGKVMRVYNAVATNGLKIYPATSGTINGGSADAAITIEGKTLCYLVGIDGTNWAATFTANT